MSCCGAPLGDKRLVTILGGPLDGLRLWMNHALLTEPSFVVGPPAFHDTPLNRRHRYRVRPVRGELVYEGVVAS